MTLGDRRAGLQGAALLVDPEQGNGDEVLDGERLARARRHSERDELQRLAIEARLLGEGRERFHRGARVQLEQHPPLRAGDEEGLSDGLVRLRDREPPRRREERPDRVGVRQVVIEQQAALDRHSAAGDADPAERPEEPLDRRFGVCEHDAERARTGLLRGRA